MIRENCFLWSSFHIKNTHSLCSFSYVCLSFNYVSSCLFDVQLGSILSFNYYFLSLNYPWSFSHWIITVCHAISYLMNFIELWLFAIQLVNIVSISIDRLYLSPQKHRWLLTLRGYPPLHSKMLMLVDNFLLFPRNRSHLEFPSTPFTNLVQERREEAVIGR